MFRFKPFIFLMFLMPLVAKAQLKQVYAELKRINFQFPDTIQGWDRKGEIGFDINQSYYSNWQSGEESNVGITGHLNQRFNYQTKKMIWDNLLLIDFGLNKNKDLDIRKTQDKAEFNSILGYKLSDHWSASYFLNLQTQITNSYDYNRDNKKENRTSGFLAPLHIATGPGILWKKNNQLNFNIAPITGKITYINGKIHRYSNDIQYFKSDEEMSILGIPIGEKIFYELGFYSSAMYEFNLMENVKLSNRVALYSNYLDKPKNIDLDYTLRVNLAINQLLTTQIVLQTRYDDNELKQIQARESIGVGIKFKI